MSLIQTIRKHGVKDSLKVVGGKVSQSINRTLFYAFRICPIDKTRVVLESEGDLCDNTYALYDYMRREGYLEKYHIIWMVNDLDHAKREIGTHTSFVSKSAEKIQAKRSYYLATCGWHIYDHCNMMADVKKREEQTLVYLSHGWGYKAAKGGTMKNDKSTCKYITSTGKLAAEGLAAFWGEPIEKILITGYPRIDYFYQETKKTREVANEKWKFKDYKKVIFWMPTFRKSNNASVSEEYIKNETGLPIFETRQSLQQFSAFLKKNNILLVFKLHHLQAELPVFTELKAPVIVVRDEDLAENGIQLYQFLALADALISDYSSVSIDYLALDRPIVYTLDDYEQYNASRGLFPQDAINYMPGYHVYTEEELEQSIFEICQGIDKYADERKKIQPEYHEFLDGNSSKRILTKLGILLDAEK